VYFDNLRIVHERGRITEENHYYAYGLKIAGISSTKAGDVNEGELKNRRQYQGAFSEYDEDIQWNDFALRNYDPQIARWVQQDPYQQFASPYVALGGDPVNMVDPSGGWAATGLFSGLGIGTRIGVTTLIGAIGGAIATAGSGNAKGLIVGAFLGLASNFIGSGSWSIGLNVGKSLAVGGLRTWADAQVAMQRNVGRQLFGGDGPGPKPRIIVITEAYYKSKPLPNGTPFTYDDNAGKGKQIIKVGTETTDEGEDGGDIITIKVEYNGPTAYGGYVRQEVSRSTQYKANKVPPKFTNTKSPDNPLKIDLPSIEPKIDFNEPDDGPRDPIDKPGTVPVHLRFLQKYKKPKP
jgi:RHS repeat-associated protein